MTAGSQKSRRTAVSGEEEMQGRPDSTSQEVKRSTGHQIDMYAGRKKSSTDHERRTRPDRESLCAGMSISRTRDHDPGEMGVGRRSHFHRSSKHG